jgi:transcriptional regulator GlxA family with amidase domain
MRAALVWCLDTRDIVEPTQSQRRHQAIMQRFDAILRRNTDRPLYVLEIAKAVGASLRSLTECCHEHLGMSPKKYISLRNMHMVRRDLLAANPATTTVTDVATRYGFWQFGRFAGHYRTLFGETPSRTLRRLTGN